jgi:hypothetical protein
MSFFIPNREAALSRPSADDPPSRDGQAGAHLLLRLPRRYGLCLRGRSPLAQTWLERMLFRAMDTAIVPKQDNIPVSSRQGRPPLFLACGMPHRVNLKQA